LSPPDRPSSRYCILSSNNSKVIWKNFSIQADRSSTTCLSVELPESPGICGNSDILDLGTRLRTASHISRRSVGHNQKQIVQNRQLMRLACLRSSAKRQSGVLRAAHANESAAQANRLWRATHHCIYVLSRPRNHSTRT
jgi:hypothetical protein